MEEFAHDGHLTATARKTCANIPCHWYLVAIETAFSPGDPDIIPGDALESLEPLLRVYEGCARAYLGEVEEANLIKLHRHSGKVSYLDSRFAGIDWYGEGTKRAKTADYRGGVTCLHDT